MILVTHDRYFLDNITEWTLELDRGQGVPYKGNYSSWLEQKAKRLEVEKGQEGAEHVRELEWIRASPKARQAKSKARYQAYEKLADEAGREEVGKASLRSRRARASAASSWRSRACRKPSATGCSSTICRSSCRPAASSALSAPTAPARPRCSR